MQVTSRKRNKFSLKVELLPVGEECELPLKEKMARVVGR